MSQAGLDAREDEATAAVDSGPLPLAVAVPVIASLSAGLWIGAWQVWVAVFGH